MLNFNSKGGNRLEFTVGSKALNRLRLNERHFFKDLLLKTFDFEIDFCIPHSRNTCEHIYCLPDLEPEIGAMIQQTKIKKSSSDKTNYWVRPKSPFVWADKWHLNTPKPTII
ncbi:Protein unc-119 -like protein [Channa argus]|uniref:Protein unc-119-like protein n=1 Tax=Channa argus TaxID=215402 RepID=A0A6G1QB69_CHAAH|nr:Protein unc-119 -like protein [Channa argus]